MNPYVQSQYKQHQPNYVTQKTVNCNPRAYGTLDLSALQHAPLTAASRAPPHSQKIPSQDSKTIVFSSLLPTPSELSSFYSQRHYLQKENRPSFNVFDPIAKLASQSATSSSSNFAKDQLITRIKKINQIRQKSQQNIRPFGYSNNIKRTEIDQSHQRQASSTSQSKVTQIRDNAITFHQVIQKTQNLTLTSRCVQNANPILQRYSNKQDIIYEEQSPFVEVKIPKPKPTQQQFQNFLSDALRNSRTKIQNQTNTSTSNSRSRIKESMFQNEQNQSSQRPTFKPSEYLNKISSIASQPYYQTRNNEGQVQSYLSNASINGCSSNPNRENRSQTNGLTVQEVKKSIENMCRVSQQQMHLLHEFRRDLIPTTHNAMMSQPLTLHSSEVKQDPSAIKKQNNQRCVSVDLVLKPHLQETVKQELPKATHFQDIIKTHYESTFKEHQVLPVIPQETASQDAEQATTQLDLTCEDEDIKVNTLEDEEVVEFNNKQMEVEDVEEKPGNYSAEILKQLVIKEKEYLPDAHYIDKQQPNVTWVMRCILIDWMMEVSCEFHLKRETFYLSLAYVDLYLSKASPIQKQQLQLIGLTSIFIAAKIEEIYPRKVSDFARAADYGYTVEEILQTEIKIVTQSKWQLNPPSLSLWLNWYMVQWDIYIDQQASRWEQLIKGKICQFKKPTEESFQLYCELTQLIDCCILEIQFLQYQPRILIGSFMYLVLVKSYNIFASNEIQNIKYGSLFLLDQQNLFNSLFGGFVQQCFGFNLFELLPGIQFASTFNQLQITYEAPPGVSTLQNTQLEVQNLLKLQQKSHYEEFLSFQMHSKEYLPFVKQRCRDEN